MFNQEGKQKAPRAKQPELKQIPLSLQQCRMDEDLFELEKEHFLIKLENFKKHKTSNPQFESIQTTSIPSTISCLSKPYKSILKHKSTYLHQKHTVRFRI